MNKFLILAAAVPALLPGAAFAQDTSTRPQIVSPHIFETTPEPASEHLDYHLEFNNYFNITDLDDAEARHYSDRQIATIYKIAELSRGTFGEVLSEVEDGKTFITIADEKEIPHDDLWNVSKQEDEIDAYEEAYAATGTEGAPRHHRVESSLDASVRGS